MFMRLIYGLRHTLVNYLPRLTMTSKKLISLLALFSLPVYAEDIATSATNSPIQFSGYLESYYTHAFNDSDNHRQPPFVFSHNVTDSPSINLALIKTSLQAERVRANLALAAGTYMRANYAAEPEGLRNIYEANVGLKLSDRHQLWLDVGVMPSHIGAESAIGIDNWTLTRSLMADNSPYFETGAKLSYTSEDGQWMASGLLLTGWQRIQRPNDNTTPAIGHQLTYKPNQKITINSSSFIGNDKSDQDRQMRYFHHLYGQFQLDDHWDLLAVFDIGAQQAQPDSDRYHVWFSPALIARYTCNDALRFAARVEYYQDKHGVIIQTDTPNGFQTLGVSANMDYTLSRFAVLRVEIKQLQSRDALFDRNGELRDNSLQATTALTLRF